MTILDRKRTFTICIISYGQAKYLHECISGLLSITSHITNFVIINNGIKDDRSVFENIVGSLLPGSSYSIVHREQSDLVGALHLGLTNSHDEYIYFTAADDIPIGLGLLNAIESLEAQIDFGAMICGASVFWEDNSKPARSAYNRYHVRCASNRFKYLKISPYLGFPKPVLIQSTVFRREFLSEVTTWNSGIKLDDFPLYHKIFSNAKHLNKIIFNFDNSAVKYRRHSSNISNNHLSLFYLFLESWTSSKTQQSLFITEAAIFYMFQSLRMRDTSNLSVYFNHISIKSAPLALINFVAFVVFARILGLFRPLPQR